jgi:beta-lactamase class A
VLAKGEVDGLEQAFGRVFNGGILFPTTRRSTAASEPEFGQHQRVRGTPCAIGAASQGRIGVAAVDLSSGRGVSVMGDQPFPLASTGKVAIVATFLEGVDQGRYKLTDRYPLMMPVPSARFSSTVAPVRPGAMLSAEQLIDWPSRAATITPRTRCWPPLAGRRW